MQRILTGKVVSNKMSKTIVVSVQRKLQHPIYKKVVVRHKKYKAHCEDEKKFKMGDVVTIKETKPISKDKHFIVITNLTNSN